MTLTKEWLLKTISELEEERDATPGAVNEDAAMALAAMKLALASLEAEAVQEWTNEQCLEFLSIAFRHAEIKGDLELDDIRLGVKMVNGSRAAMLHGAAGNSPAIPAGYALVPVEPTQAMIDAHIEGVQSGGMQKGYRAMLAAAPDFREIPDSSTNNCRESAETSTNCPHCGRKPLKNRKCSVAGCEGKHVAHGLCQKHYDIEHKNNLSRRQKIRAANKRYRARKSAASQQEAK